MMASQPLLQRLEDHFISLNRIVEKGLRDSLDVHLETCKKCVIASRELKKELKEVENKEESIKKTLVFHQTIRDISTQTFPEIPAEIPLTRMISLLQLEHQKLLDQMPGRMSRRKTGAEKIPEASISLEQHHAHQLYRKFLMPSYLERLAELMLETRKEISASLSLLLTDEMEQVPKIPWKKRFESLLGNFFEEIRNEFERLLYRSGSSRSLKSFRIRHRMGSRKKAFHPIVQLDRSWRISLYAFYEDLRFKAYLFAFMEEIRLLRLEVSSIFNGRIRSTLYPELEEQQAFISKIAEGLPDPDQVSMEEVKSYLVKELYRMNKENKQQMQEGILYEAAESIPGILQKLENGILEKLKDFPEKVGVVNSPDYQKGIRQAEIRYFSPREFIEFSSLSQFLKDHHRFKPELAQMLDKIVLEFREFEQIVDFYLDSAITLTEKSGIQEGEVIANLRNF